SANARYWLNEYRFDGLRFDAVHEIRDYGPRHVLQDIAEQVRASTDGRYIHLVAENSDNQAGWLKRKDKGRVRSSRIVERLAHHLIEPANHADRRFATRLQQVSGALLAKAQEDTAGFRWTRYLAANEVGAEPEQPTVSDDEANAFLAERRSSEMTLT